MANCTLIARTARSNSELTRSRRQKIVLTWAFTLERVTRIELALSAWEADVLPLNYTRAVEHEVTGALRPTGSSRHRTGELLATVIVGWQ